MIVSSYEYIIKRDTLSVTSIARKEERCVSGASAKKSSTAAGATAGFRTFSLFSTDFSILTRYLIWTDESAAANTETEEALESLSRRSHWRRLRESRDYNRPLSPPRSSLHRSLSLSSLLPSRFHFSIRTDAMLRIQKPWLLSSKSKPRQRSSTPGRHLAQSSNSEMLHGDDLTCALARILSNSPNFREVLGMKLRSCEDDLTLLVAFATKFFRISTSEIYRN